MKNFLIKYTVQDKDRCILKEGTMRVRRKLDSLDAQIKFEIFLKKKYPEFDRLIVHSCKEDINPFSGTGFEDIFDTIFK